MKGVLFLVVGNSGSGKDAVIKWVCSKTGKVMQVKRYITRPESKETEDFIPVKKEHFNKDDYFLWWKSYDKLYGISKDIIDGLKKGKNYLVNISRDAISEAKKKWNNVTIVEISAPIELVKERLSNRGRESSAEVQKRLERAMNAPKVKADIVIDSSNSDVSIAGRKLLDFVTSKLK